MATRAETWPGLRTACRLDSALVFGFALGVAPQNKGRFRPGVSGNPGGRPKGFGDRIRMLTRDGEELIEIALKVARGELSVVKATKDGNFDVLPTAKERLDAIAWLGDRGWGKAAQPVEVTGEDGGPLQVIVMAYDGESEGGH